MKIIIHLKSGQSITMRNVSKFTVKYDKATAFATGYEYITNGKHIPLFIEPSQIAAVFQHRSIKDRVIRRWEKN